MSCDRPQIIENVPLLRKGIHQNIVKWKMLPDYLAGICDNGMSHDRISRKSMFLSPPFWSYTCPHFGTWPCPHFCSHIMFHNQMAQRPIQERQHHVCRCGRESHSGSFWLCFNAKMWWLSQLTESQPPRKLLFCFEEKQSASNLSNDLHMRVLVNSM